MDVFFEENEFNAEHVNSQILQNHTALVFKIDSPEYDDLRLFLNRLLNFFTFMEENGIISVHWRGPKSPP